ncbi:TRIM2_3 [Mytilus edulis]|uniref:TRIM2_3 n=1 Tax=Mytilus edulis TaxID=6550 RepID=A0A8S3V5G1_MYTED|nr:TRIM2_3 [Mytilus edulis]
MSVKQHGSDLQAFIGSKMLEKDVAEELKYEQNISEDDGFSQLGDIKVPAGQSTVCITGSSVFPNGRIILADCYFNKRLVIVQSDGGLFTEIPLSPLHPFDVTCIDDKTVAVTIFNDNKIQIIDTKNKQVTKTINTGTGRGITYRQGQILFCEKGKGIVGIQLANYELCTLVEDCTINDFSYIATSDEYLYYTDNGSTVKCYSVKGDKLWEYKDESIMSCPTGIAVDQHGIVYVISNKNKCFVLISADGKTCKKNFTHCKG